MPSLKSSCASVFLLILAPVLCHGWQGYDLTGLWQDDVGGRYRIRQVGNTIAWFDDRSPAVMNVFMGTISGNTIEGQWSDLPGGQLLGSGSLSLRVDSNDRLVKTGSSIVYGGSVITRIGSGPGTGGGVCTPVGTWDWVDNFTVVIRADGTSTAFQRDGSSANDGRWEGLGGNRYRMNWRIGGWVDTLALSADGRSLDGTNNVGRSLHVSCRAGGGSGSSGVSGGGGGVCADPRTQAIMDEWLSRANPPENQRPGWNVRYDSWGRLVGRTPTNTLTGLPQGVDTRLTRCEYLWSIAATLTSTNAGTLKGYVEQRLR